MVSWLGSANRRKALPPSAIAPMNDAKQHDVAVLDANKTEIILLLNETRKWRDSLLYSTHVREENLQPALFHSGNFGWPCAAAARCSWAVKPFISAPPLSGLMVEDPSVVRSFIWQKRWGGGCMWKCSMNSRNWSLVPSASTLCPSGLHWPIIYSNSCWYISSKYVIKVEVHFQVAFQVAIRSVATLQSDSL